MSRGQRFVLFWIIFLGTVGIFQVDEAYSDMLDRKGALSVSLRRIDEENVCVEYFGRRTEWNMTETQEAVLKARDEAEQSFSAALHYLAEKFGGTSDEGEEEPDVRQAVFPVQTL